MPMIAAMVKTPLIIDGPAPLRTVVCIAPPPAGCGVPEAA